MRATILIARLAIAASLAFSFAGCSAEMGDSVRSTGPALRIEMPSADGWVSSRSVIVEGLARDVSAVEVNGVPATITGDRFQATINLEEGRQRIEAIEVGGGLADQIEINVDTIAPRIVLTEPSSPFVHGTTLVVAGRAEDANPVTVLVDGEEVSVGADGSFMLERAVPAGAHRVRVEAQDPASHRVFASAAAIVGDFARPSEMVSDAAGLALGTNALREIGEGAGVMLTERSFDAEVQAGNPAASGWWGRMDVTNEEHGIVTVALDPNAGSMGVEVVIADLQVDFTVDPSFGGDMEGHAYADRAIVRAPVGMAQVDGTLDVTLESAEVTLEGFRVEMEYVPSWFEDMESVRNAARERAERGIENAIRNAMPGFLERAFDGVLPNEEITILGVPVAVRSRLSALSIDDGGIAASVDLSATAADPRSDRVSVGYLLLGDRGPAPESRSDVTIDVALDTLNMASFAAWSAGLFQRRIDSVPFRDGVLTVSQLGLIAPGIGGDLMAPDAPVSIAIDLALPPVATAQEFSMALRAADIQVELFATVDGREVSLVRLSLDVQTSVTPAIEGGELTLGIGEIRIAADPVGDAPSGLPRGERLDELLTEMAETFAAPLLDFGGLRVPQLAGFTIAPAGFMAEGGWVTFEASLRYR